MSKIGLLLIGLLILGILSSYSQTTCNCALPIDGTFQIVPMTQPLDTDIGVPPLYENDNATTPAMALPFNFCFYGQSFDSVFISNNGIVSFVQPIHSFIDSTQTFPLGVDTLMISPFFADANTLNNAGVVYYKITPTYMVVIWDSVRFAGIDVDGWNTFQLIITNSTDPILPDGNNVSFCYPIMQWACSETSGGFSGYGGTPAFIGVNKGDGINYAQIGTFSLPGNVYDGPFSPYNGVDWLTHQSFMFNTCVTGNVIAPVIFDDRPACNTLYICPCDTLITAIERGSSNSSSRQQCDTVSMTAAFICAVPGQTAVLSYSCTGALNIYSVVTNTANFIDSITIQVIPVFTDSGTHTLSLIATDTVAHVQSTVTYTVVVTTDCLIAGIPEPENKNDFSVYPNPTGNRFTIKFNASSGNTAAKIYDVLGTQIFSSRLSFDKSVIDVSEWARGMYFVQLFNDNIPISVKKIVLQ